MKPSCGLSLLTSHLVVALIALVGIGGATRVMEAGLACPDWPLCYGSLLPGRQMNLQVFLEWFHRLDAFLVGLALLFLQVWSLIRRDRLPSWLPWASGAALLLVVLQGGLGALTVTRLLRFDLVTAHLSTALALVALVSCLHQGLAGTLPSTVSSPLPSAPERGSTAALLVRLQRHAWWLVAAGAALLVFGQAVSGALMASRWASGRCLASGDACRWLALHRQLASPVALCVLLVSAGLLLVPERRQRHWPYALAAGLLVVLQVVLGLLTLRLSLAAPLVTVAHQITAALLLAVLAALAMRTRPAASAFATAPGPRSQPSSLETCHG